MAVSVTLDSYNSGTGCLYFTITGTPTPVATTVQKSEDGGTTWIGVGTSGITSPRCGYTVSVVTLFRIRLENGGELSNVLSSDGSIIRTPIETDTDISFCNSPIHIRLTNAANDATIQSAVVKLWIWNGAQNISLGTPNQTLYKDKVSQSDSYLNFEISELIKAYLVSPINAPNTNQPNFSYNELTPPAITGQGVFWQVQAEVTSDAGTELQNFRTSFATLGYRYDYEQTASNIFTATQPYLDRWYNPKIHDYFKQAFDFTKSISEATTANLITFIDVTPPADYQREALDVSLIVFINKLGLWETFTPHGKITYDHKKTMATLNVNYRDPSRIDNSYTHSKLTDNFDVEQTVTINTGSLSEEMVNIVEQIVYSPKVYLVMFIGDVQTETTIGITIDNTYITIDSLTTTIDSQTITEELNGFYKTYRQIPVILTDTDFTIKNRVNDKNKIDYNLKFEITTNLINDIR